MNSHYHLVGTVLKNVDCKIPYKKVKFKAPMGYEFINVSVSSDCPLSLYNFRPQKEMRDRILKKRKNAMLHGRWRYSSTC